MRRAAVVADRMPMIDCDLVESLEPPAVASSPVPEIHIDGARMRDRLLEDPRQISLQAIEDMRGEFMKSIAEVREIEFMEQDRDIAAGLQALAERMADRAASLVCVYLPDRNPSRARKGRPSAISGVRYIDHARSRNAGKRSGRTS